MITLFLFLFLTTGHLSSSTASEYKGQVIEGISVESEILGKPIKYSIYLPPGYSLSKRRYPVIYLLHGFGNNEKSWIQQGAADRATDEAIGNGIIPEVIIVMPDAGVSLYINDFEKKERYEDAFITEFIPHIDKTYNTRTDRKFRVIAGLSMGGYGALLYSLKHPELFSVCAALSAGIHTDDEMQKFHFEQYNLWFGNKYGAISEGKRLTNHWKMNSVLEMMKTYPVDKIEQVRYYINCGDDDFLFRGNSMLHIVMTQRKINHEFRIRDGAHNWKYWSGNLKNSLKFIGIEISK